MCKRPMGNVWLLPRRSMNEYQSWTHVTNVGGPTAPSTSTFKRESAEAHAAALAPSAARQSLWLQRGYQPIAFELLDSNVRGLQVHTGDAAASQRQASGSGRTRAWASLVGWLRRHPKQVDEADADAADAQRKRLLAVDARSYAVGLLSTIVELPRHAGADSNDEDTMADASLVVGSTLVRVGSFRLS